MKPEEIFIKDFTYDLPPEKIAAFPLPIRDRSKLLLYSGGKIEDRQFTDLPNLIDTGTTMVFNDTKVIAARIIFQKSTGARVEIFCLEPHGLPMEEALAAKNKSVWNCMIGGASKWKPGHILEKTVAVDGEAVKLTASYMRKDDESFVIRFEWQPGHHIFSEVIHAAGAVPLPPYIKRQPEEVDEERYQTVFSRFEGSVAAPTAALHFSDQVMKKLEEKGIQKTFVTLHVGAGTFKPVKSDTIAGHHMHGEVFSVNRSLVKELLSAEKIIAVGTTSLRTIESLHWLGLKLRDGSETWELDQWECYEMDQQANYKDSLHAILNWMDTKQVSELHCRTSLIIVPGYHFKVARELITNFHQPQSTLLLLVAAFAGNSWKTIYEHALNNEYRFLSYGDSSYLRPAEIQ